MAPRGLTPEQRFWRYVGGTLSEDGCWTWWGAVSGRYGKFFLRREAGVTKVAYAHRFSYEMHYGPITEGMEIDHTCGNTLCVNPRHLEEVTGWENKSRQGSRQTHCVHGHEFTAENTYVDRRGQRRCRTCAEERRLAA